jgi:4-alpha-glucanotransferase
MTGDLDRLAAAYGIVGTYRGLDGNMASASDEAVKALLEALGSDLGDAQHAPEAREHALRAPDDRACHLPPFLEYGRAWGITCQVYGLRSARNWGIGDFEDLARLGEFAARLGADFLGVNPLHALFLAEPQWASPFYPSDRNYLNPLYIAVDRLPEFDPASDADAAALASLRDGDMVKYPAVAACKLEALRRIHRRTTGDSNDGDFVAFVEKGGEPLRRFALFQAISLEMKHKGVGSGWLSWPEGLREPDNPDVLQFANDHGQEVDFQLWLQWVADRQLGTATRRLQDAGMRIGLYLDLAVGTAPDGAATWSDRALTVMGAEIGAPPDMFNPDGQKWGLAPLSPTAIVERDFRPVRRSYESILRHAGALRIDHAMSLYRLFWIPWGYPAREGAYVLYPMTELIGILADVSQQSRSIVIGEDLGVVPEGFRHEMERANILGYRLFYFERNQHGFVPPAQWPRDALACVGSHDTPTLAGWWTGSDIDIREKIGLAGRAAAEAEREARTREKHEAIAALRGSGWRDAGEAFEQSVAAGIHRLVASSPSRLMAVQLEDLLGLAEQANIPGTVDEHPNWRRRLPVAIEDIEGHPILRAVLQAVSEERPRAQ